MKNTKWELNEVEKQFVAIEPETALKRYLELEPSDEAYARFSLKLMMAKRGEKTHE